MTFGYLGMAYSISVVIRSKRRATRLRLFVFLKIYGEKARLSCYFGLNLVFLLAFILFCKEAIDSFTFAVKASFVLWLGTTSRKSIRSPCKGDLVS